MHSQVHRDLKPANVMLSKQGVLKLSDFGISKQLESTAAFAMTQCGTTQYMSPERLQGESYNYVSDVWSAGVVVLECVTGRSPFGKSKSFMALMLAICESAPPEVPEEHPEPLRQFVAHCLRKAPADRPTARSLLQSEWLRAHADKERGQRLLGEHLAQLPA